jgi:hypothetical protein
MSAYAILQSGFLAFPSPELLKKNPINEAEIMSAVKLGKQVPPPQNPFFFNEQVESLFERYSSDHRLLREFEFREDVLRIAKYAFMNPMVSKWFQLQLESPFLTTMHRRFLLDTFKFIEGNHREIQIENWMNLIIKKDITPVDKETKVNLDEYFISDVPMSRGWHSPKISHFLSEWVAAENGHHDLIYSLKIIFGRHAGALG